MTQPIFYAELSSRAVISLHGPDWRQFLQGLITQDIDGLSPGGARFAALLTPQGRVLFDLFVVGSEGGCLIDCEAARRAELIQKLLTYRLRAKVQIETTAVSVAAAWGGEGPGGWVADPRLSALGSRGYGAPFPLGADTVDERVYQDHCLVLGVPGPADWGHDTTYPIEANFDLLGGIDFKKGCFIGQETTSRMKRRGVIKNRMAPIVFDGPPPPGGTELLAGDLRAGVTLSGTSGSAMALLRLDRLEAAALTMADGRPWRVAWPEWLEEQIAG